MRLHGVQVKGVRSQSLLGGDRIEVGHYYSTAWLVALVLR